MKICHVCKAECEDYVELCPVCGADLIGFEEEKARAEENEEIELKNPVLLASPEDVVSAEIFKDILKDNGIPYTCGESEEGTMKVLFGGGFVSDDIYVDSSDFDKANELYEEFLNSEAEFGEEFFEDGESEE